MQEATRARNAEIIKVNDAGNNFIESGIVSLDKKTDTFRAIGYNGIYQFKDEYHTGFYDKAEVWHPVDAHLGETVYLMTYGIDGSKYVAYYGCDSNSPTCSFDVHVTDIQIE